MVGQDRLKKLISNISTEDFPNVILLVGEEGCGKRTLVEDIIKPKLNLDIKDITDNLSYEEIGDIYLSPISYIYIIDVNKLKNKKIDFILKFLEDVPLNSYVVLLSNTIQNIIPTILGRCQVWKFDAYSNDELEKFISKENLDILKFIRTPGKLLALSSNSNKINDAYELCNNILLKYKNATLSNLLSVSNRLDWNNDDALKFNVNIFYDFLIGSAANLFKNKCIDMLQYNLVKECVNKPISKKYFEKFLVELKSYGY